MKTYVLYHAHCQDGLGAKYAAWKKFGDQATYIPVQYGKPLPEISGEMEFRDVGMGNQYRTPGETSWKTSRASAAILDGHGIVEVQVEVYILDFSYPLDVLEELRSHVSKLMVLDHHKTAEEALRGYPHAHFDMNKSGAVLAWEYFHPGVPVPMLLQHVQDRDLWKFQLQGTKEVHASLMMLGDDMNAWSALGQDNEEGRYFLTQAVQTGHAVISYEKRRVESALKNVKVLPYKGCKAGVYNTTTLVSELGSATCRSKEMGVDFSLSYFFDTDGQPVASFRSIGDFDVSELAKELGGGGHKNAAGARVSPEFIQQLYQGIL